MQRGDVPAANHQLLDQVETDKAGPAGDEGRAPRR